jgi:hypothetical protein
VQRASRVDSFLVTRGSDHVALRGHDGPLLGVAFIEPGHDEVRSAPPRRLQEPEGSKRLPPHTPPSAGPPTRARAQVLAGREDMLYSAALDNTLRSWDPLSLQCR